MNENTSLQSGVLEALEFEPGVHAERVGVTADDGIVTLTWPKIEATKAKEIRVKPKA